MGGLYEAGWRQGTVFEAPLELNSVVASSTGPTLQAISHGLWLVVSQDCDLAQVEVTSNEALIELRPVYTLDPPHDWGIRSSRLLLTDTPPQYIVSTSPRVQVTPAVLTDTFANGARMSVLDDARRRALKLWLGLRYDRPAIPDHLLEVAKAIGVQVARRPRRKMGERVRDVLMQFDDERDPIRFSLFAVLADDSDETEAREWLADIAGAIPIDLGVADELEAAPASRISLELVETSYAADVTQLTWTSQRSTGAGERSGPSAKPH